MLYLDFETRSRCDLRTAGVYNYAQDPSTEVLCMSYAFDDDDVQTWTPGMAFPREVRNYKGQIRAHNAAFERLIFWHILKVPFALEQFHCTAAQARANCAPGSLEDVGRFAGAGMKKDHRGAQLIRALSVPQSDGTFREDAALMAEMIAYCEQDVRAMRAVSKAMRQLTETELHDYHVNERINDRGVQVDVALCRAAIGYSDRELLEVQDRVAEVTDGAIRTVRSPKTLQYVLERVSPETKALMWNGERYSIDKSVRANLLAASVPDEIQADAHAVVECLDAVWSSSVAKFARLADLADARDERVRGAFVFAGGAATGRASSYGAQVHNFTSKTAKAPEEVRQAIVRGHAIVPAYGPRVSDILKGMLRPALVPAKGKVFVAADWAAIEARVNPWLSGNGEDKLEVFRTGGDVYKVNASATFKVPVDQVDADQRQIGKVQELACGFGGGVGAFAAMGRAYGLVLPEPEAKRMVQGWRMANPWGPLFWQELETAYTRAMRNKGYEFSAGRVTYLFDGTHLWYALPSGRVLCYPYAKLEHEELTYAKASWKPAATAKEWPRARLWRGLACENVTQATAHDLLRHSLRALEAEGIDVVLHIHDEIVVETDDPDKAKGALERIMTTPPDWAGGLPLNIKATVMTRYGKG